MIDSSVRLNIRVTEHTLNITGIHFDDKVVDTNEVKVHSTECVEQAV